MYRTIFSMKVKSGHHEELLKIFHESDNQADGMVAWFLMDPDEKDELIGVAVFDSKDAHVANANRPEQHDFFTNVMKHLENEPTWTDGKYLIGEIL